jgi:hypothetical protein
MKSDLIHSLTANFEDHAQQTGSGVYWLARDIQHLLGYAEWRNFNQTAISKAKTACEMSGFAVTDHFVDVNKTIQMPKTRRRSSTLLRSALISDLSEVPDGAILRDFARESTSCAPPPKPMRLHC